MARELHIIHHDGTFRTVTLTGQRLSLGRASDNDLAYPDDPVLSRRHLLIDHENGRYFVEDLNSKNGATLNGIRLTQRQRLELGDRVAAGRITLVLNDPAAAADQTIVFVPGDEGLRTSVSTNLDEALGGQADGIQAALAAPALSGASRMQALLDAGSQLDANKPLPELFEAILDLAVKAVGAQRGVLLTCDGPDLTVRAARGDQFRVSRAVRDRVLDERTSLLIVDTAQDEALRGSMTIVQQRIRSLMAVPLQTQDKVAGIIYVDSPGIMRPFTPDDLTLLTVMANIAGVRVENARLALQQKEKEKMEEELRRAADIQRSLLPREAPKIPGLDLAGYSAPCRSVGGDYFDYLRLPDGRAGVIVADVAGKGMSAALLMSRLQALVQVLADGSDLAAMVARLNRSVAEKCPDNRFITFFMCVIDPATGEMTYCNAGHNPQYLARAGGGLEKLEAGGFALGMFKNPPIPVTAASLTLAAGDAVVLFSDGVPDAQSPTGAEFGDDRLEAAIDACRGATADGLVRGIAEQLERFMDSAPAVDDITLVAVRRPA